MAQKDERPIAGSMVVRDENGQVNARSDEEPMKWGTRRHMEEVINGGGSVMHRGEIISDIRQIPSEEALKAHFEKQEGTFDKRLRDLTDKVSDHHDYIEQQRADAERGSKK